MGLCFLTFVDTSKTERAMQFVKGIKIWSICDHLKKNIMTLDLLVNGF